MTFWSVAFALAGLVAVFLLLAFRRGRESAADAAAFDLQVYRDQLREVDKDVARGILSAEDAERARVEISRRILEADRALSEGRAVAEAPRMATLAVGALSAACVVVGATWLYTRIGAPGYPDLPLQDRIEMAEAARANRPAQADAESGLGAPRTSPDLNTEYLELMTRLRAVVAERPNDVQGLALLARNEANLGNFAAAHSAQARLVAVKGAEANAADYADLAEMRILAAGGYVSPEAEEALSAALARDPRNGAARYYTGLLFAQTGRPDLAFRFWRALLAEGPPDAPWIGPIRLQIEEIALRAGQHNFRLPPVAAPTRGPTPEQMEAVRDMDPEAQAEMIRGMVSGLAERLANEGGPPAEWAQLIRAYGILGEAERVAPVVAEARRVFAGNSAALAEIDAAARDAGLVE